MVLFDSNLNVYYISKIRKITLDELENLYKESIIQESGLIDPDTTVDLIENAMRNISITSPVVQSKRNGSKNKDSLRRSSRHLYSPSAHFGNLTLNTPPSSGSSFKSVSRLITPENTGFTSCIPNQINSNLRNSNPLLKSTLRSNLLKSAATETRMQDDTQTSFIFNQLTPSYDFKTPVKSPKMTLRSGKTYHKIDMSVSNLTSDVHNNLSMHTLNVEKNSGGGCSFPDLVLEIVAEPVHTSFGRSNLCKCCCTTDFWGDEFCAILGLNGVCHVVKYSKGRQVLSTKLSNVSQICTIDSSNRWSGKQWLVCYRDGSNWLYSGLEKLIRIHFDQPKNPDDFSVGQRINPASSSVFQNSSMLHSSAIHSNILGVSQNSSVFQSSNLLSEHHEKPRFGGIGESCLSPIAKSPDKNQSQFLMEISTPTTKTTRSNRQLKPNGQTNISNQLPFDFVGLVDNKNLLMKSEGGNLSCLLNLGNILPIELPDEVVRVLEALKSKVGKHILVDLYSRFLNEFFRTRNQNKTFTLCFYSSLFEAKIQPKTLPLGVEQSRSWF